MPVYIPSAPPATGVLRFEVVDTGGILRDLTYETSPSLFVPKGSAGFGRAPAEPVLEKLPFAPGSVLRYTRTQPQEINLPIVVDAATFAAALNAVEDLRSWFYTGDEADADPVYLRVTRPQDDVQRQIACYYAGGLEGDLSEGTPTYIPLVVSLIAPDPYWTDITETSAVYDQSDVGATLSIINTGDAEAFPVWTIAGPLSELSIHNLSTNKAFTLAVSLLATDTVTIDTRPSPPREGLQVADQDGLNLYSRLNVGGSLWRLRPGQNNFRITAPGTSADTSFGLSWLPRYRGVLR